MFTVIEQLRTRLRRLGRRRQFEHDMHEELRLHIELRARDLVQAGHTPEEALRHARLEFGHVEAHKHSARRVLGLHALDRLGVSWLDFKLGLRMLRRYPALSAVASVAIAFGIAAGVAVYLFVGQVFSPTIPLPEGDRIVTLRSWDLSVSRSAVLELETIRRWRGNLPALVDIGAFQSRDQNLVVTGGGVGEPVAVARITSGAFRVSRVASFLGRALSDADELPGAPRVAVVSHNIWQSRLGADSAVIGRQVQVGTEMYTVVGVMPPKFAFPVHHQVWVPLSLEGVAWPGRVAAVARLAPGATLREAQTQLITFQSTQPPPAKDRPRAWQVLPFATGLSDQSDLERRALLGVNVVAIMFLLLICGNVALLMLARTFARQSEIVVRTSLGASASRIVLQLFVEALVLASFATAAGVYAAHLVVREGLRIIAASGERAPFWFVDTPSAAVIGYAGLLTLLVAGVTGVMPALRVTRGLATRLRAASSGGGGAQITGWWTAVIVAQVAVTVAFPVTVLNLRRQGIQMANHNLPVTTAEYLTLRLDADPGIAGVQPAADTGSVFVARTRSSLGEIERRLLEEPGVTGVALTDVLPQTGHPEVQVLVDEPTLARPDSAEGMTVSVASVDPAFFAALDVTVRGRNLRDADVAGNAAPVIVNASFVQRVLRGRDPIGMHLKFAESGEASTDTLPWREIVGVVPDLGTRYFFGDDDGATVGVYRVLQRGATWPAYMIMHVRGRDPLSLGGRVREIVAKVDPSIRVQRMMPLDRVSDADLQGITFWMRVVLSASLLALLLSLVSIYAVMAFAVQRRTREIGIRVALGSAPFRIVMAVLARPLAQVGLGVVAGGCLVTLLASLDSREMTFRDAASILAYVVLMFVVCLTAGVVPAMRVLRVQPSQALRSEL